MATTSLADGALQLRAAQQILEAGWTRTESDWRDGVRQRFETERLEPLLKQLAQTQQVIQQFAEVLNSAKRHVVDSEREARQSH